MRPRALDFTGKKQKEEQIVVLTAILLFSTILFIGLAHTRYPW